MFRLLAAVALLGIPLAACEEPTPPPPVGTIVGQVSIEGTGIDGVSVNLSNGSSSTTSGGGNYRFDDVAGGAYTVTISGYPSDATFDATSATVSISSAGQSATVNFSGAYIRTASVMGAVTVENSGLGGVTVTLSGVSNSTAVTDDTGQYAFTGLQRGSYSVEISGFDNDEIGFSSTAAAVTVGVGESMIANFDGTYLRTAGIQGRVSVGGEGLEGVTVSLAGGPDATDMTTTTDAGGLYSFARLRAGHYAVGISGFDTDYHEFEATSRNVTVALGETANVPFEGVLLRTSGISGRVSVEGAGLEGITVTLAAEDMDDMTAMTDAGGLYAFAGLAAGEYTVAISGQDMEAYVFESASAAVTVGDDETAIVNFEGTHARTASVGGMLFVDEARKNDAYDEGEDPLPAAGVPLVLVGPRINDRTQGTTNEQGQFMFSGLKAGPYQLVAAITPEVAMALGDYAYGGDPAGYAVEVGVGEAATQDLPFDITHTTVNFTATLKSGEKRGDALPGATVTLYADAAGENSVGSGETDDMGMAAIRVARAGTTGNTVHAAISAADYSVAAARQAVTWDSQMTSTDASNEADIVNLNVDVTVAGATITTGYGGGRALAGWAIGVAADATALEGDNVPAMLDADGTAALETTVNSADDLPMTYTFSVDTVQHNKLDGGERFTATPASYTHTGLKLAGTVDAGTMEGRYTTQTLKVYVHHERDQVHGYTGNVLAGDERDDGRVSVGIRYVDDNGRSRAFTSKEWDPRNRSVKDGVHTFVRVPADHNVIAQASVAEAAEGATPILILDPDELAAYTGMKENGVTGGAFGARGGFHHTVHLCPLAAVNPSGQDHGECASFAYVETYRVTALVWRRDVLKRGDGFRVRDPLLVAGVGMALDPVPGKNLAGEARIQFTQAEDDGNTARDDRYQLDLGRMAAGVYGFQISEGWRARLGGLGSEVRIGDAFNPLAANVPLDITPAFGTLFGYVKGSDGFGIDSATVDVNGVSVVTDALGRYIATGFGPARGKVFVSASKEGFAEAKPDSTSVTFAANRPISHDITLRGVAKTASISGTVRATGTNDPVAGVEIRVDGEAPLNAATRGPNAGKLLTGADGTYSALVAAKALGGTTRVSASKVGITFVPPSLDAPAHAGSAISGLDFTGFLNATVSGRVVAPDGGPMQGVGISATAVGETAAAVTMTTGVTGTFSLSLPFGIYDINASAASHSFKYPNGNTRVSVAPGQSVSYGDIQALTPRARRVSARRLTTTNAGVTTYNGDAEVNWTARPDDVPAGYNAATYTAQTSLGWLAASFTSDGVSPDTVVAPGEGAFLVRILATATPDGSDNAITTNLVLASDFVRVDQVDPAASGVAAARTGTTPDSLKVSWSATTTSNSQQRVLVEASVSGLGGATVWLNVGLIIDQDRSWAFELASADWVTLGGATVSVTVADLEKALRVRVDSRQGSAGPWTEGAAVDVAAK